MSAILRRIAGQTVPRACSGLSPVTSAGYCTPALLWVSLPQKGRGFATAEAGQKASSAQDQGSPAFSDTYKDYLKRFQHGAPFPKRSEVYK
jgi:hypothetical protein